MATVRPDVRDRLKRYGTAGMTYNGILTRLMDEVDRRTFVESIRRRADEVPDWVDIEDVEWPGGAGSTRSTRRTYSAPSRRRSSSGSAGGCAPSARIRRGARASWT